MLQSENIISNAEKMLKNKSYNEMINLLTSIPKENYTYKTYFLLARGYLHLKMYEKALSNFNKSMTIYKKIFNKNNEETAKLHSFLAYTYQKLNKYEQSLEHHLKTTTLLPNNPVAWTNLGNLYFKNDKYSEAEKIFLTAYKLKPTSITTLTSLGNVYYATEQYNNALHYYQQLLNHVPNSSNAYLGIGRSLLKMNKKDKAYEMLAKGHFLSKNYPEAVVNLEKIPNLQKHNDLYKILIASLIEAKLYSNAISRIKNAISIYPKDDELIYDLAKIYYIKKNYNKALEIASEGIKKFPNSHILSVVKAQSLISLNQKNKAKIYLEKALIIDEKDVQSRELLAQLYREQGQKDYEYFHQALVYYYTGNFVQANEVMRWIKEFPRKGEVNYYHGMILWKLNKNQEALNYLQNAVKFKEDHYLAYIAIAKIYKSLKQTKKGV
ncbi:MAG: tetratricopeptide repeat protein, partial [Spirochaetota bacterium]|nr:tetratricopeptide repeat protein [Spirochaetota bacterium]